MNKLLKIAVTCAIFLASTGVSHANTALPPFEFTYSGTIGYHNDVVEISFAIPAHGSDVVAWTDSYRRGANFDPIIAIWRMDTGGGLVAENDDFFSIDPRTPISLDSRLELRDMPAGSYLMTITAYDNFANGSSLSAGFRFDHYTPIPMTQWVQPESGMHGGYWEAHIAIIPEPEIHAMLLAGMVVLGYVVSRKISRFKQAQ